MSATGTTRFGNAGSSGLGIKDARNGLNIVTVGVDRYVELGGVLIHDTEISSTLLALYKLGLLNTSFYIRGDGGINPVTGAGARLAYIPSQRVLYFGNAAATQFDLSAFITDSLIIGNDFTPGAGGFNVQHSMLMGVTASTRAAIESLAIILQSTNALLVDFIGLVSGSNTANLSVAIAMVFGCDQATIARSIAYINSLQSANITDSLVIDNGTNTATTTITNSLWIQRRQIASAVAQSALNSFVKMNQLAGGGVIKATRCFYFLTDYTGGDLTESDIARWQTGSLAVALKIDIANGRISVGTETSVGIINIAAGTSAKPTIQYTIGTTSSAGDANNTEQYDGQYFTYKNNVGTIISERRSFLSILAVTSHSVPTNSNGALFQYSSALARTVNIGASSIMTNGDPIRFKDSAGTAAVANITINPPAGKTIDGAAAYVISTNYGSVAIYYDGTQYYTI